VFAAFFRLRQQHARRFFCEQIAHAAFLLGKVIPVRSGQNGLELSHCRAL
jgi:hypothetical protein